MARRKFTNSIEQHLGTLNWNIGTLRWPCNSMEPALAQGARLLNRLRGLP
jgi:hypothetical protein